MATIYTITFTGLAYNAAATTSDGDIECVLHGVSITGGAADLTLSSIRTFYSGFELCAEQGPLAPTYLKQLIAWLAGAQSAANPQQGLDRNPFTQPSIFATVSGSWNARTSFAKKIIPPTPVLHEDVLLGPSQKLLRDIIGARSFTISA